MHSSLRPSEERGFVFCRKKLVLRSALVNSHGASDLGIDGLGLTTATSKEVLFFLLLFVIQYAQCIN